MPPERRDHVITKTDFPESPIARWNANIEAIRLIKQLETDSRPATGPEQEVLGKYSGFGDSAYEQAFKRAYDPAWVRRKEELESLVSPVELDGIRRSRLNAFYTTPAVVNSMWDTVSKMGVGKLDKPKVLEPSAGSGRFLGLQPKEMAERSERTAVELDPMTAGVLKHLYPKTKVYSSGFQDAPVEDNHYDVAISNVPFGNVKVYDKEFNATNRKYLSNSVHNYFFAKTLDKLRPGGVMAYVTTHHTMDAPTAEPVRRYLADKADLVGAVRLPEDAFPDTQVITDIMYLKKRAEGEAPGDDSWVESVPTEIGQNWRGPVRENINRYYVENPSKVLGRQSAEGGMYRGDSYTVKSDPDKPVSKMLPRESAKIARRTSITPEAPVAAAPVVDAPPVAVGTSKYVVQDGELQMERGDETVAHDLPAKAAKRVTALVGLRDTARKLVEQEGSDLDNKEVDRTRASLRDMYEGYVEDFGTAINTPANRKLLGNDADDHLLFALEKYDKDTECWQPSDIMSKRIVGAVPIQKVRNVSDAMTASLNETGKLDFERMGKMLDRSPSEVREELESEQLVFKSPKGDVRIPKAEYLSGNVRSKLKEARVAAAADPAYKGHVDALEQVQPSSIKAEDIATPLGAPWIPASVVNEWVDDHLYPYNSASPGQPPTEYFRYGEMGESFIANGVRVGGTASGGGWVDAEKIHGQDAVMKSRWGTPAMPAHKLLLKTLQGKPVDVKVTDEQGRRVTDTAGTEAATEKAKEIQESFNKWIWENPVRRERLEALYNEKHNANAPRIFDGSHQTFPGMAREWQDQLHEHQRDAIYRAVHDGTVLMAHEVGFGKSATMVASAMERKRLGLANKPVFVVPKATHEQFVGQFMEVYPGAKLLAPDKIDFQKGNREAFLSRIATGDWDGVILTTEHFEKIPLSPETEAKWLRTQKAEMQGALAEVDGSTSHGERTQKQMQKKLENYEVRLQELRDKMAERSDDTQTFESLGVDQIYVDEADRYKNLPYVTNKGNVKGLPQSSSQRAWDMYMKIRYLQEQNGEKPDGSFAKGGVVFATGTPVANTIAEAYTMMRYLQPGEMNRQGLGSFDAWAKTYGEETVGFEQTVAGAYKPVQRFANFVNLPELSVLLQNVADIRVASEVPQMQAVQPRLLNEQGENKRITVVSPTHEPLQDYMADIIKRVDNLGDVDPTEDNMLKISSDARKAALDVRMVEPKAPHNPEGKISMAAENISRIFKQETPDKGTQFVFLDIGTPKASDGKDVVDRDPDNPDAPDDPGELTSEETALVTNIYKGLRKDLNSRGVPDDQIAFIHDYKTAAAREDLFAQVRAGAVRVLVGSTEKIGVGVNVQDRAAAAHHIDIPWRPRDLEQREGRIIRQGNEVYGPKVDEKGAVIAPGRGVQIYQYAQEGSFDTFMWQAIESKARAIKSLMKRKQTSRRMEDIDSFVLGAAEAKALASGNPLAVRAEELRQKVDSGRRSRSAHQRQVHEARSQKGALEFQEERYKGVLPALQADAAYVKNLPPGDFEATIGGQQYAKRPDASNALAADLLKVKYDPSPDAFTPLGSFKGFEVGGANGDQGYRISIRHPQTQQLYNTSFVESEYLTPLGMMSRLDNLVKTIPDRAQRASANLQEAQDGVKLYNEQISKQFDGAALTHAERQLVVIQARLQDNPATLPEGYDYNMDVQSDTPPPVAPPAVDGPRVIPDADSVDLREAVEIARGADNADTPGEIKEALQDELRKPATPAAGAPSAPEARPASVVSPDGSPPAEIRAPLGDLDTLAGEFNFGSYLSLDAAMRNVILGLWQARNNVPEGTAVRPDIPAAPREYPDPPAAAPAAEPAAEPKAETLADKLEAEVRPADIPAPLEHLGRSTPPAAQPEPEVLPPAAPPVPAEPKAETLADKLEAVEASPAYQETTKQENLMRGYTPEEQEAVTESRSLKKKLREEKYQEELPDAELQSLRETAIEAVYQEKLREGRSEAEARSQAAYEVGIYRKNEGALTRSHLGNMIARAETTKEEAPVPLAEPASEPAVDLDAIRSVRREIRALGGAAPNDASQEELQALRDDLKAGGTAGKRIQVVQVGSRPQRPTTDPEITEALEANADKQADMTAAELIAASKEGPVPLTGPGSIMNKLAEEQEARRKPKASATPEKATPDEIAEAQKTYLKDFLRANTFSARQVRELDKAGKLLLEGESLKDAQDRIFNAEVVRREKVGVERERKQSADSAELEARTQRGRELREEIASLDGREAYEDIAIDDVAQLEPLRDKLRAEAKTKPETVPEPSVPAPVIAKSKGDFDNRPTLAELTAMRRSMPPAPKVVEEEAAAAKVSQPPAAASSLSKSEERELDIMEKAYLANALLWPEDREAAAAKFAEFRAKVANGGLTLAGVGSRVGELRRSQERLEAERKQAGESRPPSPAREVPVQEGVDRIKKHLQENPKATEYDLTSVAGWDDDAGVSNPASGQAAFFKAVDQDVIYRAPAGAGWELRATSETPTSTDAIKLPSELMAERKAARTGPLPDGSADSMEAFADGPDESPNRTSPEEHRAGVDKVVDAANERASARVAKRKEETASDEMLVAAPLEPSAAADTPSESVSIHQLDKAVHWLHGANRNLQRSMEKMGKSVNADTAVTMEEAKAASGNLSALNQLTDAELTSAFREAKIAEAKEGTEAKAVREKHPDAYGPVTEAKLDSEQAPAAPAVAWKHDKKPLQQETDTFEPNEDMRYVIGRTGKTFESRLWVTRPDGKEQSGRAYYPPGDVRYDTAEEAMAAAENHFQEWAASGEPPPRVQLYAGGGGFGGGKRLSLDEMAEADVQQVADKKAKEKRDARNAKAKAKRDAARPAKLAASWESPSDQTSADYKQNLGKLKSIPEESFPPGEKDRIVGIWESKAAEREEVERKPKAQTPGDAKGKDAPKAQPKAQDVTLTPEPPVLPVEAPVAAVTPLDAPEEAVTEPEAAPTKRKPASKEVVEGEPLYQGHKGPGIGYLQGVLPERRDGDGDTVVAERRPRKADEYELSPEAVPPRLTDDYKKLGKALSSRAAANKRRKTRRKTKGARPDQPKLESPGHVPSIKVITR